MDVEKFITQAGQQNIGVCAVITNSKNQILLGKRKNSYKSGTYGMPGGRVEINESLGIAINREILEETALENLDCKFLGVVRENQGVNDFIHFIFSAKISKQEPRLCEPDKCEGWQWFALDDLPENILTGHLEAIEIFKHGHKLVDLVY